MPGDSLSLPCGPGLSEVFADLPDSYSMVRSNDLEWTASVQGQEGEGRCQLVLREGEEKKKKKTDLKMEELPDLEPGQTCHVDIKRKVMNYLY